MMEAPHIGFVAAAYAFAALVVAAMIGSILRDYRAQSAAVRRLEASRGEREAP